MSCAACVSGTLHGGTPTGTVETLHGLPTYIAEPPPGTEAAGVVVIIPDAFGWVLPNNRILADNYAKEGGFRVLLPDFMDGHWADSDLLHKMESALDSKASILSRLPNGLKMLTGMVPFMYFCRPAVTTPRVTAFVTALRAALPATQRIGVAGFCWGGKHVTQLCGEGEGAAAVDCGFVAHPSSLAVPGDIAALRRPYSVAHASADFNFSNARCEETRAVLERLAAERGLQWEIQTYEGATHGFAVRGDPSDEKAKKQGMEAEAQAVKWFKRFLVEEKSKL